VKEEWIEMRDEDSGVRLLLIGDRPREGRLV